MFAYYYWTLQLCSIHSITIQDSVPTLLVLIFNQVRLSYRSFLSSRHVHLACARKGNNVVAVWMRVPFSRCPSRHSDYTTSKLYSAVILLTNSINSIRWRSSLLEDVLAGERCSSSFHSRRAAMSLELECRRHFSEAVVIPILRVRLRMREDFFRCFFKPSRENILLVRYVCTAYSKFPCGPLGEEDPQGGKYVALHVISQCMAFLGLQYSALSPVLERVTSRRCHLLVFLKLTSICHAVPRWTVRGLVQPTLLCLLIAVSQDVFSIELKHAQ